MYCHCHADSGLLGEILWDFNNWDCHISVPSALDAGDNKILIVGGYELGALMIEVQKKANGSYETAELFTNPHEELTELYITGRQG